MVYKILMTLNIFNDNVTLYKHYTGRFTLKKFIMTLTSVAVLSACTSATHQVVNTPISNTPTVSKSISQESVKGLKRVVAIGRFSDETKRGNTFLLDQDNNRIGKQASDILSSRLTDSGQFLMLERSDLNALIAENQLEGNEYEAVGADYLIIGSVSEFGRSTESDVGVFSRNKVQKANVTVNVRLVDTKTSQIIFSEEASGAATSEANRVLGVGKRAGYDTSLDDAALSAAISKLVSNLMENLMDAPWQAYLLDHQEGQYFLSGGEAQGVRLNDTFRVLTKGKKIKNPQTGMLIEMPGKETARIKVVGFAGQGTNALSITSLESGNIDNNQLSNYIVREL
ncbi:CsgG/HfaB family protein [Thalassotalea maritima]|uniref:CsgG/HfaB family protein n=1 Tax=Thalassotalea maritima TaxID=3242416 RepID=UPI0035293279